MILYLDTLSTDPEGRRSENCEGVLAWSEEARPCSSIQLLSKWYSEDVSSFDFGLSCPFRFGEFGGFSA